MTNAVLSQAARRAENAAPPRRDRSLLAVTAAELAPRTRICAVVGHGAGMTTSESAADTAAASTKLAAIDPAKANQLRASASAVGVTVTDADLAEAARLGIYPLIRVGDFAVATVGLHNRITELRALSDGIGAAGSAATIVEAVAKLNRVATVLETFLHQVITEDRRLAGHPAEAAVPMEWLSAATTAEGTP